MKKVKKVLDVENSFKYRIYRGTGYINCPMCGRRMFYSIDPASDLESFKKIKELLIENWPQCSECI